MTEPEVFTCSVRFKLSGDTREYTQVGDASGRWCLVPCEHLGNPESEWMPKLVTDALNLMEISRKIAPKVLEVLSHE